MAHAIALPADSAVHEALLDIVTAPNMSAFRANMIARDHGVHRIVHAIEGSAGFELGIGIPGGTWQWGSLRTLLGVLGL